MAQAPSSLTEPVQSNQRYSVASSTDEDPALAANSTADKDMKLVISAEVHRDPVQEEKDEAGEKGFA